MFSKQRYQVLYAGFVQTPSGDSKRLRFLSDIFNAKIHKTAFSSKTYTVLNELLNCLQRESCSFGENYPLSFLTIVYNSPIIIRVYLGLATVLLFVTIVLDEVTPKDMCMGCVFIRNWSLLGTLSNDDDDGSENVIKKWICVVSNLIVSIWTHSMC